ncbi:Condensin-1 complex subunit CAP-D2 [Asimina triloba]
MAHPFSFPSNLHDLESDAGDDTIRLSVQSPIPISSFSSSQLDDFLKGVVFDLSDKDLFCIEEQDVFDRVYSLVRDFSRLSPSFKLNLVESLRSNLAVLLPNVDSLSRAASPSPSSDGGEVFLNRVASYRNAFKIYTFFLLTILQLEESNQSSNNSGQKAASQARKRQSNSWNWEVQRSRILNLIAMSLEINLMLLFGSSAPDESYLSFVVKHSFSMFENQILLKDADTKDALCRIIGTCATKYQYTAQSCASILHLLHKYDFVTTPVTDIVAWAEKKYADGCLAVSLIREIGRTNTKDYMRDPVGAENVGRFLVELADRLPKLVSMNVGILVPHFGGESHKIRNALIGVLGKLVSKAFKDVDGDLSSKPIRLRSKQAMLDILLERCRDVSAYTRSKVLQIWAELCEEHAVSIGLWNEVASVASGRLEDKSAFVRKAALNLLIMMLQHNPFGPQLRIASFEATLEKYKEKLREMEPTASSESVLDGIPSDNDTCGADGEIDQTEVNAEEQDSIADSCLPSAEERVNKDPAEERVNKDPSVPDFGNLEQTRALVASLETGLGFSKCISSTMPILVQLLASPSATDVENTILLLMRCRQFQIDGSEACLRKMLPLVSILLVFSQDKSIYSAVEDAFITIYLTKNPGETAANLLNLAIDSSIGDLAALEVLVGSLVSKGDISTSTIAALWDSFSFSVSGVTAEQSRGALSILCMAAKSSNGILGSHLQDIIDIGFGRWAKEEPLLARTACVALQRLSKDERDKLMSTNGSRVFAILQGIITGFWLPENIWYSAAEKAISAIYSIHPTPESFAADVVKRSLSSVFDCSGGNELQNGPDNHTINFFSTVQVAKLSRFLFIVSHVALNQLVYIESCVRTIQKQKTKEEKLDSESRHASDNEFVKCQRVVLVNVVHGHAIHAYFPQLFNGVQENGINAELGLAASKDAILDTFSERAEQEIVSGSGSVEKNLIGCCAPFLSKLCAHALSQYPELQASGMLALCRLMIIDGGFCQENLQLLFTVVESSPTETVRSNCTIALGDLAVRYPNLLEPWTENVYARLRDPSISVRKNAVLVLSHLILNDMMKVKGYINEMAVRLEDEDERIANLAKLFFHELSKKGGNPIYNLLPDILGRLSNQNLKEEAFRNIMQFLIGSIKKDKQMEALVEKICNRFSGVAELQV